MRLCDLHRAMEQQTAERRFTGRSLRTGDLVQEPGRGYREVVSAESAGVLLDERAHRERWRRGSAAEACALHGGSRFWSRGGAAKE